MTDIAQLVQKAEQIEGWMPGSQLHQIADFTEKYLTEGGVVCEIGTWKGRSTYVMASIARDKKAKVVAIDTFAGSTHKDYDTYREALADPDAFFKQYAGKTLAEFDNITFIKESSETAHEKIADNSLDICFIDGDHDLPTVEDDIRNYLKKVKPGGLLYGHDFYKNDQNDVHRAVVNVFGEGNYHLTEENVSMNDGTIWFYKKPGVVIPTGNYNYLNPGNYLQRAWKKKSYPVNREVQIVASPADGSSDVYWFLDNNIFDGNRDLMETRLANCQYAFYTQPDKADYFKEKKGDKAFLAMFAADPDLHFHHDVKQIHDVGFLGELRNRAELLSALRGELNFMLDGNITDPLEYSRMLSECKILFNKSDYGEINMRVFESMAIGCLLTNKVPGMEEVGEDGKHFVLYDGTLEDARKKIKYLLEHDDVRKNIEKEARKLVLEKHTYQHRLEHILKSIGAL